MAEPNQTSLLMQRIVERTNLQRALKQVQRNKGAPGVDGMTVEQLPNFLKQHWPQLREQLVTGRYKPQPVKRVEIPKANGKMRKLGIPTVVDRFVQQAIAQVLSEYWETAFHPNSFGFRPHKSAHQAIRTVQNFAGDGYRIVVDLDLASFFDEVNHDRLMARLNAHTRKTMFYG
jgi:RNA-directed DNA polymerase